MMASNLVEDRANPYPWLKEGLPVWVLRLGRTLSSDP